MVFRRFQLLLLLLTLFSVSDLLPQGTDQEEDVPFRVAVDAVNVLATIHDKDTRAFITDLTKEDFEVYEDGALQSVTNFAQQVNLPLTIGLCLDTSSSVRLKLPFEKETAIDFLYAVMRPFDRVALVEFDTGVTLLHDFTSNPNELIQEIEQLKAGGGTSLYDAIYLVSEQKMLNQPGRKTLVILSDGADLTSKHTFEETLRMAYQAEITIYAISTTRIGADVDHEGDNALKQLTERTGGRVFFPYSTSQLTEAFQEVNQELRSQYNLTYVPTNKRKDGKFREIKVKVSRDSVNIRHRQGYFAPEEDALGM
ncbi:MAG: VWA domain-containing protein [Acidobacteriota bacterium]|nr:VWA domain-containing protein [Acidobacteriota bacterium]